MTADEQNLREAVTELRMSVAGLTQTQTNVSETLVRIEKQLDKAVNMADFTNLKRDVDGLLKLKDFVIYAILGIIITALLGLVIVQNGGSGPL